MKTIFGVASIPEREKKLKATLESILPQADLVHVYLNNYPDNYAPEFLQNEKIFVYRSEAYGDRSDAGKFFNVPENCYYLSIDDDIIYPADYAEKLIAKLKEYHGQIIVSHHGRRLKPGKAKSYYKHKTFIHHCLRHNPVDRWVHIGGTGVMAFDTNYFRPTPDIFKRLHMADIWIGKMAQEKKMPILALAHDSGYIKPQGNAPGTTIFDKHVNNDSIQTSVCNSINWILNTARKPEPIE